MGIKSKLRRLVQKNPWGSVQFFHQQKSLRMNDSRRFTVAVAMPTVTQLAKLQQRLLKGDKLEGGSPQFSLRIGKATVNPKDQYTREIGRKFSFDRITPHQFYMNNVNTSCGKSVFEFSGVVDNQITRVYLTVTPYSDRAQLTLVSFRKLPSSIQEVASYAKPEEVSTGTQDQNTGSSVRPSLRDERGGIDQGDSERRTFGVGLQEQGN